ncbi:hypothetical protein PSPL106493_20035 [Pseudomonas plecoglossicida]
MRATDGNRPVAPHIMGLIQLDLGIHVALGMHDDLLGAGLVLEAEEVGRTAVTLHRPGQEAALSLVRRQRPRRGIGAVVQATHDQRAVGVAVEEHHHHFVFYPRNLDTAKATTGTGLRHTDPARTAVIELALAVPVELHLHPAQFVGEDFLAWRADHDGRLRASNDRPGRIALGAKRDFLAHARKGIEIARLLVAKVVVVAFAAHLHQQELALIYRPALVAWVLQQFETMPRAHRPTIAGTLEPLAGQLQALYAQAQQCFPFFRSAVGVLAGIVHFEARHRALLVEAVQSHLQAVARLAVVEGLRDHAAGLQLATSAPLGDRIGGLGDGSTVETNLRLLREYIELGGVIADDQRVAFGAVLEVIEKPRLFQQTVDKVEVAFAVLGKVGVALLRVVQAQGIGGITGVLGEDFGEHFIDRAVLEDACVGTLPEHCQPGAQGRAVAIQGTIAALAGEMREVAVDEARGGIDQFDLNADLLADHRLERHRRRIADQLQFVGKRLGQPVDACEAFQQQRLVGVGQVVELEQSTMLWRQPHRHFLDHCALSLSARSCVEGRRLGRWAMAANEHDV